MKKTAIITTAIVAVFLFASVIQAQTIFTTKKGYLSAMTESDLDRVMSYAAAEDNEALGRLIFSKHAFMSWDGLEVYLMRPKQEVDFNIKPKSYTKVEVRPVGKLFTFWTFMVAIEKK